uniref:Putative secreted protein n=1 Tax=Anopheles aquasalis TaxID=42839 RepID=T1E8I0_ANOAQ
MLHGTSLLTACRGLIKIKLLLIYPNAISTNLHLNLNCGIPISLAHCFMISGKICAALNEDDCFQKQMKNTTLSFDLTTNLLKVNITVVICTQDDREPNRKKTACPV